MLHKSFLKVYLFIWKTKYTERSSYSRVRCPGLRQPQDAPGSELLLQHEASDSSKTKPSPSLEILWTEAGIKETFSPYSYMCSKAARSPSWDKSLYSEEENIKRQDPSLLPRIGTPGAILGPFLLSLGYLIHLAPPIPCAHSRLNMSDFIFLKTRSRVNIIQSNIVIIIL